MVSSCPCCFTPKGNRRLGEPQSWSRCCEEGKNLAMPGIECEQSSPWSVVILPELSQLLNESTNSINSELCDSYKTFTNKDMLKFESTHVTDKIIADPTQLSKMLCTPCSSKVNIPRSIQTVLNNSVQIL
jgi:hypothetical protein